ncbi:GntP family permease [Sporolactobacillus terrae]|uniref:GntP family permease n=1 Tax=Sporolactobacillus terrae TaxID=269673 RepID=UPI00048B14F1|nr:Na+/H+ antiporter NhaC family protein [Sporolactobacillus terrae]
MVVSWLGAVIGLILAIVLILKHLNPVYALMAGAVIGALIGGADLTQTVNLVVEGTASVTGTIVRVLAAGVLAGVMMETGAAEQIARTIVARFSDRMALFSLALATMIITAVGVFIPVAVIIVAPIALAVGEKLGFTKLSLLLALSGGGKAGNIISPNANTIMAAKGFHVELSQVMIHGFIPAIFGLIAAVVIASLIKHRGAKAVALPSKKSADSDNRLPSFGQAVVAPLVAIVVLMLNPIGDIFHVAFLKSFQFDAMYILPVASIIGLIAMGKTKHMMTYISSGVEKMTGVVMILIGAGALAGLVAASNLSTEIVSAVKFFGIPGMLLSPLSGILMGAAVASTSTGVIIATQSFAHSILSFGVSPVGAAVMMQAGAVTIDQLPQGNYFHVTRASMGMRIKERLTLVPYEALVGLTMVVVSTIIYGIIL